MPRTDVDELYRDGVVIRRTSRVVSDAQIYREGLEAQLRGGVLANLTPDQADTWIDANVTTLAGARAAIKILARLVIALRDRG